MKNRVRIGTCAGPADAALIRSVFEAHELQVVISGENHAGMFAGLGGFISLDILVAEDDAEEAVGLLRDIREGDHAALGDAPEAEADEHDDDLADERADAEGVWGHHADEPAGTGDRLVPEGPFDDRRRRTGIVLVLGVVFGVGAAHMFTRAWLRGFLLAGIQFLALLYLYLGTAPDLAALLLIGVRIYDPAGAIWRIWAGTPPTSRARAAIAADSRQ
jgi:hypothetical protein